MVYRTSGWLSDIPEGNQSVVYELIEDVTVAQPNMTHPTGNSFVYDGVTYTRYFAGDVFYTDTPTNNTNPSLNNSG